MMEILGVYNKNYKLIQSIYSSRLKIQILLSLAGGIKLLSDLREVTGSTSQALIPKIRSLERLSLIQAVEHGYTLTPLGRIAISKIEDFISTMAELNKHRDFWTSHDIDGIPPPFLNKIGDLLESEVMFDTPDNIFHIYAHYLEMLKEAKYIYGISYVMSPMLAETFAERVVAGIPVELIVNRAVAETLQHEPFLSQIGMLKSFPNFQIWVTDEVLKVGITVTDKYLSFGLNKKEINVYDSSSDLTSFDPKALEWARSLFMYYKNRSVILTS
jgi:predicted transcriptional regulator